MLGVAPWGFAPAGGGTDNPDPGGIGGATGCFWPGKSMMCPLFNDLSSWRTSLYFDSLVFSVASAAQYIRLFSAAVEAKEEKLSERGGDRSERDMSGKLP